MPFDPQTTRYPYTERTDQHYLVVKKNDGKRFDKSYPYIDRSFWFRFKQFWTRILLVTIAFPVAKARLGLKVKGKKNIRANKALLKDGVISCANHVHLWDYIAVMYAAFPRRTNVLVWATNVRGENKKLIRMTGGIPIPDDDTGGTLAYYRAVRKLLNDGGWLHIYAEGSMWEYYAPIRPFKRGIALFADQCDKPILPMAFSYRKPGWIRRKIFHQIALLTLTVGEPLTVDRSLPKREREDDLLKRCHEAVCRLAGIRNNPYSPVFRDDKRIDSYPPLEFAENK
ncbi:MAG: 1-acyl-sn-glycerol-3-phosphate acyltransferase [Clostridia bacterium]|nr:1-acyl-sn-glycerol-3-phosphate acyltransferase [Clostridia bacterium]